MRQKLRLQKPGYDIWRSMRRRCLSASHPAFPAYGGRGVQICDRWIESYEYFLSDMGIKPSKDHSLDRINPDGNYEPSNCRWATKTKQARNRSESYASLGVRGVRMLRGRYFAYIHVNRSQISLGGFDDFFNACCARKSAENTYWQDTNEE